MKKKKTSVLRGAMVRCLLLLLLNKGFGQNTTTVSGVVIDEASELPVVGVLIGVEGTDLKCISAKNGHFVLEKIPFGKQQISLSLEGYTDKMYPIKIQDSTLVSMGTLYITKTTEQRPEFQTIVLDDEDFVDNDIGGATVVTGLLQSSKDVFLRTAAFNFGPARFKIRGYDSREGAVLINGIKMNKVQTGRPQWSNWGGLNDVLRNVVFTNGLGATPIGFGSLLGSTNFSTRAMDYRPGSSASLASTNGSYKGRIMASHFTGTTKKGWAFAFSASSRFAQNGVIEGTTYNAYSGFFAVEKKINEQHRLNFTAVYAFNSRGKSSPNTQEVLNLRGATYNSYWGLQDGEKRNARMQEIEEPLFILNHHWKLNPKSILQTSISYQFGYVGASRLGYANVDNPDPTYYKKMPSYFLQQNLDYSGAYLSQKHFQEDGQIDWSALYETNFLTDTASYYVSEDRNEDQQFSFNAVLNTSISLKTKIDVGVSFRNLKSLNYAKVLDVLGGTSFLDIDSYAEGDKRQSDLNNRNRQVKVGDAFSYKYELGYSEINAFIQSTSQFKKWELTGTIDFSHASFQREGLYQNGAYPENSFGKGESQLFSDVSFKINGLYAFSGRHLAYGTIGLISRAPTLKNVYRNIRINNTTTPNSSSEKIKTIDLNYQYRAPKIKARFTGYYTLFSGLTENSFLYAQGLRGEDADFIAQLVTGIQKQHFGIEFGMELELSATISMNTVAALGQFTYHNNPNLHVESDLFTEAESDFGRVHLKGYKLGGTPQRAYSLGFSYRDPNYWWVAVNGNVLTHNYLSVSPLLRTSNFYTDSDGVPFVDEDTGNQISQQQVSELLQQERFEDLVLVNLVGGKSWKLNDKYIGLFVSLNNVLGTIYKTGGFEQSRKANYKELKEDKSLETPLFGPKYWVQNGARYYVILSYRF